MGESMSRIKVLAQSHREYFRSRSPEHHKIANPITERPLRSPFSQDFTANSEEDRLTDSRRPLSSRIGAGRLGKASLRSYSARAGGSSRGDSGLNTLPMAKV